MLNAGVSQMWGRRWANTVHRAVPVLDWPALGIPLATARSYAAFEAVRSGVVEPDMGAAAGTGKWIVGAVIC